MGKNYTAEKIMCYPIDMERVNKMVNELLHKGKPPDNTTYSVSRHQALIKDPTLAIIDEEFVGSDVEESVTWYVYGETKVDDKTTSFSIVPVREITMTLAELEQYLLTPTSLAEFTKSRRGYNSRIIGNEHSWMSHFNDLRVKV